MLTPAANALTLTVLSESVSGRDSYGNDVRTPASTAYDGCAWWPTITSEDSQGRTTVTSGRTCMLPDGAVVTASDRIQFPDGSTWRVQGDPEQHTSPWTGARGGVIVLAQKVAG